MNTLLGKRLLLGVTGGIAAYKSAELVRQLRAQGAEVRVVMTAGAQAFITPLTLQTLSGQPVHTELLDATAESTIGHIALARWADVLLIAPATADCIARLSQGRADDLLAAVALACEAPVAVAPAMNRAMWEHPATRANVDTLRSRGVHVFGPAPGEQACGETGPGRLLEPAALVAAVAGLFETRALTGRRVLVTAGPTREGIDPVRYLSNHSSGRMGYAVAQAAAEAGAEVTLVSGPVNLETPARVRRIDVVSALDMQRAVLDQVANCDIFIAVAAVADYRVEQPAGHKLKKTAARLTLHLVRNPDILAEVAALPQPPFTVGFAAETESLAAHAHAKLAAKGVDMIAANQVGPGQGFGCEDNALRVIWAGGERELPLAGKHRLARQLLTLVTERYNDSGNRVIRIDAKDSA
ncbi:MAG: bifunctional phosphopantothenoylcysteine decarboxylase/phosphopantothenate--cysteine ligase CoaBC [Pseudomonadota bacterium]